MADLKQTIASSLAARCQKLGGMANDLAAPLTDTQFWSKPFPFGNSFGHLVLHLTGNLNYYIGAQIAQTGYVRDRLLEFADATRPSKGDVLSRFDHAIAMVVATINQQSADDWSKEYAAVGADAHDRLGIVLACVTHVHHHIGQMMYLKFELERKG